MTRGLIPGAAAGVLVLGIVAAAFAGLSAAAVDRGWAGLWGDTYVRGVLAFTVWQAALSTALAIGLAVPAARALSRRTRFPGRTLLLRLLGLPMVVPVIVGVLGIVAIYGRSGWLNRALGLGGSGWALDLYGLAGILLAHVFFNMPFAARVLVQGWASIPPESWRLAAQLGMSGGQVFRLIEWPMLRQMVPGLAGLIFLLCFTSFTVVLTLGGGPPNQTLEVAIFQALRFEFDLTRVVSYAALQVGVCALLVGAMQAFARPVPVELTMARPYPRYDGAGLSSRVLDAAAILLAVAVLVPPLVAVAAAGLVGPVGAVLARQAVWLAAARSLAVGCAAGLLALALGWALILTARQLQVRFYRPRAAGAIDLAGSLIFVVPPFVIGAGLFVLLRPFADVFALGLPLVVLVNALMGLPFVLRVLGPPAAEAAARHWRLCDGLGMRAWDRFRLVDWPALRRPAGLALALCTALSFGDFGVIALFGTPETRTLPLLLYDYMGTYRLAEAAVVACLLVGLCLAVFLAVERLVGGRRGG